MNGFIRFIRFIGFICRMVAGQKGEGPMTRTETDFYTIPQAAQIFRVNRVTLWRWIKAGRLTAHQMPTGHYRIRGDDLRRFLNEKLSFIDLKTDTQAIGVLVVDDDALFRKLIKKFLSDGRFAVEGAANGFEAGLKILKHQPSLLILDLYMPEMDGFEVCRTIRNDTHLSALKIIAVTGYSSAEVQQRIIDLGADRYLEKPIEKKGLLRCINELLVKERVTTEKTIIP